MKLIKTRQNNVKPPEKFIFICSLDNFYYNFPGGISHCLLYFILVICFVEATNGLDSLSLISTFTFVARDSNTRKSAPVNQVLPESEQEKILWEEEEELKKGANLGKRREQNVKWVLRMKIQIGSMHCWLKDESSVICQHWQTEIAS